jgi:hypothetical protein
VWGCLLVLGSARADQPFTGEWQIDLRTRAERRAGAECGFANFKLIQRGDKVTGEHSMATVGCGRLNEGGEGTVEGIASGNTALLLVTSGRNGEVVRGRAVREGANLRWQTSEQVKPGEPEGDSGLILGRGVLQRVSR